MGVGAGLYMYVVVVQKFTFAISSPDEFLFFSWSFVFTARCTLLQLMQARYCYSNPVGLSDTFVIAD